VFKKLWENSVIEQKEEKPDYYV